MPKNASIDMHVHSTYSDGSFTPDAVARRAADHNVVALAITDHDTQKGTEEKRLACGRVGIECVVGVELSCEYDGSEAHIVSLFADPASPAAAKIEELGRARERRMELMLERLDGLGFHLEMSDLEVGDGNIFGRPHLARALVAKGLVQTVNEAFARYLYDNGPVYIPKVRLTAEEGINLAKSLGGVAVLAHPGVSGLAGKLDAFAEMGVQAIEAHHPKHGGETVAKILRFCREKGLAASGGSDFHSPGDTPEIGSANAPVDLLEPLRQRAAGNSAYGKGA